ncbi:MAG: M24 family metallopeptidase [Chloroflexota bacterium]
MRHFNLLQSMMRRASVDLLLVTPGADLHYLTGYAAVDSERPTVLVLQAGVEPFLLLPRLEEPRVSKGPVPTVAYEETDDPFAVLAGNLGALPEKPGIAISDQARAAVVLGVQEALAGELRLASPLLGQLRMRKSADEIAMLEQAAQIADEAFADIVRRPFAGRTEQDVAAELRRILSAQGLDEAGWGPIVGSGPNSASPHHITSERIIQGGDAVILDFGGQVAGYQADITRTVHVGQPDERFLNVYGIVRDAQQAGVEAARPGIAAEDIDRAARGVITEAGFGKQFVHRTGHGLGLEVHEQPFMIEGNDLILEPGMVFSVEPGIYVSGEVGVRIEDIVVVEPGGSRRLNHASRDIVTVR